VQTTLAEEKTFVGVVFFVSESEEIWLYIRVYKSYIRGVHIPDF
jgi:hypothetical protein